MEDSKAFATCIDCIIIGCFGTNVPFYVFKLPQTTAGTIKPPFLKCLIDSRPFFHYTSTLSFLNNRARYPDRIDFFMDACPFPFASNRGHAVNRGRVDKSSTSEEAPSLHNIETLIGCLLICPPHRFPLQSIFSFNTFRQAPCKFLQRPRLSPRLKKGILKKNRLRPMKNFRAPRSNWRNSL